MKNQTIYCVCIGVTFLFAFDKVLTCDALSEDFSLDRRFRPGPPPATDEQSSV